MTLTSQARALAWLLAGLVLAAGVTWLAVGWTAASGGDRLQRLGGAGTPAVDAEPGLTRYLPGQRATAPTLQGTTLDGQPWSLASQAGQVVVINVWGSWCGPCRLETPDLVRLARESRSRGVRFAGIDTRDNPAAAQAFVRAFQVPYPSLADPDGQVLLTYRAVIPTSVVPSTVVIDRQGQVAARVIGPVTYPTLQGILDDELGRESGR